MKRRVTIAILLLGLILIMATSCGGGNEEATSQQPAEGDIIVTVTGDGNIEALSHQRLTFGSGGKVDKISVKKGDNVNKGDVLAKLDTDALELALNKAQVAWNQAQAAYNQAQIAVTQAQAAAIQAQASVTQAEVALQTAEFELEQTEETYTLSDIKAAQSSVVVSKRDLEEALWTLSKYDPGTPGWEAYQKMVNQAQLRLNAAKDELDAMLFGADTKEVAIKKLRVEAARQSLEAARQSSDPAKQSVELAQQSLEINKKSVALAWQSVELAQKQLDEATITAPFDGTVANIGVKEGEFLSPAAYTGTTIVEIIDLRHMELTARVDELDVVKVKTGQKVMISVDAMPGTMLEGRVTFISPVAREPGVVLFEDEDEEKEYEVKIDFDITENSPIRAGMSATAEIIVE
ncbi:HlyD family secretion protein [Chloroflexota bacterium]